MRKSRQSFRAIDAWYLNFVEFGFEFGGRLEEVFGAKWSHVNLITEILGIREARTLGHDKNPKTEASIRDVDITPGMLRALKRRKRGHILPVVTCLSVGQESRLTEIIFGDLFGNQHYEGLELSTAIRTRCGIHSRQR